MSTCDRCGTKGLIAAVLGDQTTVLLDPHARTYVAVDEHMVYPEDQSRVFLTTALVEHAYFCASQRLQQAQDQKRGKEQYDRQQQQKAGR